MPTPWTLPWREASGKDLLDDLLKEYRLLIIPTNAGWSTSLVGSGICYFYPVKMWCQTGTTASSRAMSYTSCFGFNSGDISSAYVDWTKRLEIDLLIMRIYSDPECIARFQVKESNAEGALAQMGVGLEIRNFDLYGEGYGTSRGTVALGTLTADWLTRVKIVKDGSRLEFWVEGVLKGVLTGDNVPNAKGSAAGYLVVSIVNGPTGGVNACFAVGDIIIVQRR